MSYSIKRATLIADQLERLATQNAHQLAGQFANLDFWIAEVIDAIRVIQQYPDRFRRLRDAQVAWVRAHDTKVSGYCPICGGACEFDPRTPDPPLRIRSEELADARAALQRAGRAYLLRLYKAHLLEKDAVRRACDQLDIGVEEEDFHRVPHPADDDHPKRDALPDPDRTR
jgi:hypothetical protein